MSHKFTAAIKAGGDSIYSKFRFDCQVMKDLSDPDKGSYAATFNCNSDVTVPKFWSEGSDKAPKPERTLIGTYTEWTTQGLGFDSFEGTIGDGRIYLTTGKGIVIKGAIKGGPDEGQTITGRGTWTQA
jgi:hypothetical protein